jgi:sulfatase maturation enzyme AslB (radical SAM superfamily)
MLKLIENLRFAIYLGKKLLCRFCIWPTKSCLHVLPRTRKLSKEVILSFWGDFTPCEPVFAYGSYRFPALFCPSDQSRVNLKKDLAFGS